MYWLHTPDADWCHLASPPLLEPWSPPAFPSLFWNGIWGSIFASFDDLLHKFGLPRSSLFRYFQVRHFLQHHDPNFPSISLPSGLDDLLESPFKSKKRISRINDCVTSFKNTTLGKIRADWEDELGEVLEENIWESALVRVNNSSSCAKLNIIQFKILHHIQYSKARLAKIYPNIDASCDRCRNTPADLTHMFYVHPW